MRRISLATFVLLGLCFAALAAAQAPTTIVYQGRLSDASGTPITTETTVVFSIYAAASGGAALWTETKQVTPDGEGLFTVELGASTALGPSLFSGGKLYLGIKVGSDAEMVPRQVLTSMPYAQRAAAAPGGGGSSGDIQINVYGTHLEGSAYYGRGFSDSGGVMFPESPELPSLDYSFTVPTDYAPGTPIYLDIFWMTPTPGGSVNLRHNWGTIQRVGSAADDFNISDPAATAVPATAEVVAQTTMNLGSSFQPGDAVVHGMFRSTQSVSDTATGNISIGGMRLRYTTQ